jgi:hypothetical protein
MTAWRCNACGESGEGSYFEQCWTMPLVGHGWPEDSRHHWPSGKPASADEARFFSAVRERFEQEGVYDDE